MSSTLDGIDVPPADASNTLRRCKALGDTFYTSVDQHGKRRQKPDVLEVPPPEGDHLYLCHDCPDDQSIADHQLQNVCGVEGCMNAPVVMNTNEGGPPVSSGCPEWMHHPIDICDYHCDGGEDFWSMIYYDASCGKWRELPEELRTARRNVEMAQEEFQRAHKKYKIDLE